MKATIVYLAIFIACLSLWTPGTLFAADAEIEEVVVTGSYIKRKNQADFPSPVNTVTLEDMKANGWSDMEDVAETFTFSPSNYGRSGLTNGCCGNARAINLRGLGVSSTLVLLNGKRTASTSTGPSGADYTNIKRLLPMIAVSSLETLLDGGAALYGSDAVAGVVNMKTRTNFEGFEARIGGKQIDGSGQNEVQFIIGAGNEDIHGIFAFGFEHQDSLQNRERDFNLINNTSGNGSPGTYVLSGRPINNATGGDVIIDNGTHGAINYSSLWDTASAGGATSLQVADPYCVPDLVPAIGPVPGGGQFSGTTFPLGTCRSSYQPNNSTAPQENSWQIYTHWDWRVSDYANVKIESSMYRSQNSTTFIATFPQTNGRPIVPASSPFNQLGTDLSWAGRSLGLAYPATKVQGDANGSRLALTLDGSFEQFFKDGILSTWSYMLTGQYSGAYNAGENPDTDLRRMQDGLNGFGGSNCEIRFDGPASSAVAGKGNCYYFSPFGANIYRSTFDPTSGFGSAGQLDANGNLVLGSAEATADVIGFNALTTSTEINERRLTVFEMIFSGDLFELPGGTAGMAFGYQQRKEVRERLIPNFQYSLSQGFLSPRSSGKGGRTVDAYFGELALPLTDNIDIQLAARFEDYGDIDSTDPKIGINWRATETLSFRASAGTSFRAPSLGTVVGDDKQSSVGEVRDSINVAEQTSGTFRTIIATKNPLLEPEESRNYNVGVTWAPEVPWGDGGHNFQVDLDYFDFEFENQIRAENANSLVAADPCSAQIQRDRLVPLVNPVLANVGPTACPANVGAILIVNVGFFNAGETATSGFDLSIAYDFDFGDHQFNIRSETTIMSTYDIQASDGGAVVDGVGFLNGGNSGATAPPVKSNLMLGWGMGYHSSNITVRYIDAFEDDAFGLRIGNKGQFGAIDSHVEVDAQYRYTFGEDSNYDITIGAVNIFDEEPPAAFFTGYVESVHNPYMRQVYVRAGIVL